MAKKLTKDEQELVLGLTKLLGKRLPVTQRKNAGGIASGLVHIRKDRLTPEDVNGVLSKYGAGESSLQAMEEAGVLVRVKTRLPDGTTTTSYILELPDDTAESQAQEAEATSGRQASDETPSAKSGADGGPADAGKSKSTAKSGTDTKALKRQDPRTLAKSGGVKAISSMNTIRKQSPEVTDVRVRIIGLDPRLWINGWLLSVPEAYVTYERELKALSQALDGRATLGDGTLSRRELSYQIFGDEKFLAIDSEGAKLLHCMGLTEMVCCRPQPKLGMQHHVPRWHARMRLVVSENLDPWTNMRDVMYRDGKKHILGERVHGVIFGDGHLANDAHKLPELVESLGADEVEILYWGDIDRAGLQILDKLTRTADGRFAVTPFVAAYQLMIRRAMERWPNPQDNEAAEQERVPVVGLELVEPLLKKKEAAYLRAVIEGDRRIPQEIVTRADL